MIAILALPVDGDGDDVMCSSEAAKYAAAHDASPGARYNWLKRSSVAIDLAEWTVYAGRASSVTYYG